MSPLTLLLGLTICGLFANEPVDLTSLSLEEFLNVEVVSVSKGRQKLSRTAAAVYVITHEDIRRSGAASIPDALRLAPGVHVARISGTAWAVGIRGFNSSYSNKLLVLVDGRSIYHPLFSGVVWNLQMVMLEDVERIEVIRGPGATMWGANAVSGVINIVTRKAGAEVGGMAAVSGGSMDAVRTRLRYGGRAGRNAAWRGSASYGRFGTMRIAGGGSAPDPWDNLRGSLRVDWESGRDALLAESDFETASAEVPQFSYRRGMAPSVETRQSGGTNGFGLARWTRATGLGGERSIQGFYDRGTMDTGLLRVGLRTFDLDAQQSVNLPGRHRLIAGGGVRWNTLETRSQRDFRYDPAGHTYRILNGFLQDEWHIQADKLVLTAGAKLEHYEHAGMMMQPTARLLWAPTARQVYWVAYARAARTPSHTDYALRYTLGVAETPFEIELKGSWDVRPEILNALEAGGRWQVSRRFAADVAAFWHRYSGLQVFRIRPEQTDLAAMRIPAVGANGLNGWNRGGEAVGYFDVRAGWQLVASYTALFDKTSAMAGLQRPLLYTLPSYSPRHQGQLRSAWDVGRRWTLDAGISRVGALAAGAAPGYQRVDLRVARKVGEWGEISFSGQNLLKPRVEFAGDLVFPVAISRRIFEIGFTRRF